MAAVTVLLPVYNGERYLHETMRSILSQTYTDFEFLIVDDGSTDASRDIIAGYGDPRIRVLVNPDRLKLSGALNRGIDEAGGTYIARMDADDIALPGRLQTQVDYLESHPHVAICGTGIEVFGQTATRNDIYAPTHEDIRSYALFDCPFCHPTVMIRKELFDRHGLRYDGSYYPTEDYELWSRAVELLPSANLSEVLLRYRVHGSSMTGADWDEMDRQAARVIRPRLEKLGIACSGEQLQFHRNIGRGRSVKLNSLAEVERAEAWLNSLLDKNRTHACYDEKALAAIVETVWFRVCMNSSQLGFSLINRYRNSSILSSAIDHRKLLLIVGSVMKQALRVKRADGE